MQEKGSCSMMMMVQEKEDGIHFHDLTKKEAVNSLPTLESMQIFYRWFLKLRLHRLIHSIVVVAPSSRSPGGQWSVMCCLHLRSEQKTLAEIGQKTDIEEEDSESDLESDEPELECFVHLIEEHEMVDEIAEGSVVGKLVYLHWHEIRKNNCWKNLHKKVVQDSLGCWLSVRFRS